MTFSTVSIKLPYINRRQTVLFDQIVRLEADINYTLIYFCDGSQLLVAQTLKQFYNQLPANDFIRAHRKHVVNRAFVDSFSSASYSLQLLTGERIGISRRKLANVRHQLRTANNGLSVAVPLMN